MPTPTCSVDGCDNPHSARGWCNKHYQRAKRWGDPLGLDPRLKPGVLRFPLSHVTPEKRAQAWASQVRFDLALELLR